MNPKRTRPMHWMPPHTAPCPACKGKGRFEGLFHDGPCAPCHGSGLVREDGEQLPIEDVAALLRARLSELEERIRRFTALPEIREATRQVKERRQREADARVGSRFD